MSASKKTIRELRSLLKLIANPDQVRIRPNKLEAMNYIEMPDGVFKPSEQYSKTLKSRYGHKRTYD